MEKKDLSKSIDQDLKSEPYSPAQIKTILDLDSISLIKHDKKKLLLELLFAEAKTIMELSKETGWNPGTIKRHLLDLTNAGLVVLSHEFRNEYSITQKYYRASAFHFRFEFEWPPIRKEKI